MARPALLRSAMLLLVVVGPAMLRAADDPATPPDPAPPPGRPSLAEIRERFKNLTPEERAAQLKAIREKGGPMAEALLKRRSELEKLRQETRDLPPAQREARIREWRQTNALSRPFATMSPEEREARRTIFKKRIEAHMATLHNKTNEGSLTEEESRRLKNMERMLKWLESSPGATTSATNLPLGLPPPATPPTQPAKPGAPTAPK